MGNCASKAEITINRKPLLASSYKNGEVYIKQFGEIVLKELPQEETNLETD